MKKRQTLTKIIIVLQIFFFICFLISLITPYINEDLSGISFMRLDVLSYLFSFKMNFLFIILLFILLIQLFFGRVFCSFICPMGNAITFFDWLFKGFRGKENIRYIKGLTFFPALLIIVIVVFRLFDINLIGFFSPLAIISRFFTLMFIPILKPVFRYHFNPTPFFTSISLAFLIIILFSFMGERIWCKFVCPLGFIHRLFSIPARYVRKVEKCTSCQVCFNMCPMDAIDEKDPVQYDKTLCILCFRCRDYCPGKTNFVWQKNFFSRSRRDFLKTLLSSFVFLNFMSVLKEKKKLLRPPGATEKSLENCMRCMECARVCPTGVIQPAGFQHGLKHLFTPQFRPDISYCDYECNLCGRVCPNNSLSELSLEKKQQWKIGTARVDRSLCIVWNNGLPCLVCEEHCPIPEKAIKLEIIEKNGKKLQAPVVDQDLCIGCGICQSKCPSQGGIKSILVEGTRIVSSKGAAIKVYSLDKDK
ncbi:MAG: 4Fe-4S dicluster domain-containing protein [Spirochaetes bacterium]|nr:4Fe-4S dicluster domain-containing protein [Spirochaetota bacterium]